jgi:hypothetical protein
VWNIRSSTVYKLPAIELSSMVREKDVSIFSLYSNTFIRVNSPPVDSLTKQIHLYSVANDQVIVQLNKHSVYRVTIYFKVGSGL